MKKLGDHDPKKPQRALGGKKSEPWKDQEERVASKMGGQTQPASGALSHAKGDARTQKLLIEAKQTSKKSNRVTLEQLQKISEQAVGYGQTPAMALSFDAAPAGTPRDWVLVPRYLLDELDEIDTT